jgi:hypothetical protein
MQHQQNQRGAAAAAAGACAAAVDQLPEKGSHQTAMQQQPAHLQLLLLQL